MASFTKTFPIPGKSAETIYSTVAGGLEHFLSKTPLGEVKINRDDAAKKVGFKASMASGSLTATEGALQVEISLSMLASAFKGKIDEGVTKWIQKTFPV